jgi:hypothetical protein
LYTNAACTLAFPLKWLGMTGLTMLPDRNLKLGATGVMVGIVATCSVLLLKEFPQRNDHSSGREAEAEAYAQGLGLIIDSLLLP